MTPDLSKFTNISISLLVRFQLYTSQKLYPWLKRQYNQFGTSFRCSQAELINLLEVSQESTLDDLLQHELYWVGLELTQLADFSFTATAVDDSPQGPAVQFTIIQPAPSSAFGYLILARNEIHIPNIYLITIVKDQPEVYLDKLSDQPENLGRFELIDCYPILDRARVRKHSKALLKEYKGDLVHGFHRMDLQEAKTRCRQLVRKPL